MQKTEKSIPDRPSTLFPNQSVFLTGKIGRLDYPMVMNGTKPLMLEIFGSYDGPSGHYEYYEKEQFAPNYNAFFNLGECPTK